MLLIDDDKMGANSSLGGVGVSFDKQSHSLNKPGLFERKHSLLSDSLLEVLPCEYWSDKIVGRFLSLWIHDIYKGAFLLIFCHKVFDKKMAALSRGSIANL